MNLNNQKLSKFKHDVGNLLADILRIQAETNEASRKARELLDEFFDLIDTCEE